MLNYHYASNALPPTFNLLFEGEIEIKISPDLSMSNQKRGWSVCNLFVWEEEQSFQEAEPHRALPQVLYSTTIFNMVKFAGHWIWMNIFIYFDNKPLLIITEENHGVFEPL